MSDHQKLREAIKVGQSNARDPKNGAWTHYMSGDDVTIPRSMLEVLVAAAESTLPKTKMVDMWHIEWSAQSDGGGRYQKGEWFPVLSTERTEAAAIAYADNLRRRPDDYRCIRVTGPHQQEVPA